MSLLPAAIFPSRGNMKRPAAMPRMMLSLLGSILKNRRTWLLSLPMREKRCARLRAFALICIPLNIKHSVRESATIEDGALPAKVSKIAGSGRRRAARQ